MLRKNEPPIVIENEFAPAGTLHVECLERLGRELNSKVAGESGSVNSVVAIRSPESLKECVNGDAADRALVDGIELEYAVYHGKSCSEFSRFPSSGFITGKIEELIAFIRPASLPNEIIEDAADALERGAGDVAAYLVRRVKELDALLLVKGRPQEKTPFAVRIEEILRQPWPTPNPDPKTPKEVNVARMETSQRSQTAMMCATILINALAYQQNLASVSTDFESISALKAKAVDKRIRQSDLLSAWDQILESDYWPIFHIAKELLAQIEPLWADAIMDRLTSVAESIQGAIRQSDVAGIVFQRLIADRQTLATYYTTPASTVLAAHLAIPDDRKWAEPEVASSYKIADYACGSGGLILAAYQRVRELHRSEGVDPDAIHKTMMEDSLTACDIMPAAVHLSSSLLSSVAPGEEYDFTRSVLYPYGGNKLRDEEGNLVRDLDGDPLLERDAQGKPVVDIGSLELLDLQNSIRQVVLPLSAAMAFGAKGEQSRYTVEMLPKSQSLVIMNPPFTTPTNHAAEHSETKNPAFASFGTSDEEQEAMEEKVKRLSKGTVGDGYAGLASQFSEIADNMVADGGHISLILPLAAMLGGSFRGKSALSWQKLRTKLANEYGDIVVTTISGFTSADSTFSADTNLAECLVVARKLAEDARPLGLAHFVNLKEKPDSKLEAQEIARAIRGAISAGISVDSHVELRIGDDFVGTVRLEQIRPSGKWTSVRVANMDLVGAAKALCSGKLILPQRQEPIDVPIAPLRRLGSTGPVHRSITDAFIRKANWTKGSPYPMLWSHDEKEGKTQKQMQVPPDSHGIVKAGKGKKAAGLWDSASNLHFAADFGFSSNAVLASFTKIKAIGGRAWPSFRIDDVDHEKALSAWFNSTMGMICFWIMSNRGMGARGSTTVTAIPDIPALNIPRLAKKKVSALVGIFDELKSEKMLPANESYRDHVRQELDRRILTQVLGLGDEAVEQFVILRDQWCAEPTVTGTKSTGISRNLTLI